MGQSKLKRFAYFFERAIFFAMLVLIALAAIPYGATDPWWEGVVECAIFILTALWVIHGLLTGAWGCKERSLILPLFATVVFAFLQKLPLRNASRIAEGQAAEAISSDPYGTGLFALKLLAITLFFALCARFTSSARRLRALIYLIIGVCEASALFGILRQTVQREPGFILEYLMPGLGYGQFINRDHFAFLMEMGLGLILGLIIAERKRRERLLIYFAMAAPLWTALVLANSRGGILSMLGQLIWGTLLFYTMQANQRELEYSGVRGGLWRIGKSFALRATLIISLLIAGFVGAIWIGGEQFVERLESVQGEIKAKEGSEREYDRRIEIWRTTWAMIKDNPMFGVGFGGYWIAFRRYQEGSGKVIPQQAHNDYLEILASGGLVGAALLVWFVVSFIKAVRQRLRIQDAFRRAVSLGAITGLFGIAIHSFFDFGLHTFINALIFVSLIVIATADVKGGRVEQAREVSHEPNFPESSFP